MSVGNLYPLAEARGKWTLLGRHLRPFLSSPALSPGEVTSRSNAHDAS